MLLPILLTIFFFLTSQNSKGASHQDEQIPNLSNLFNRQQQTYSPPIEYAIEHLDNYSLTFYQDIYGTVWTVVYDIPNWQIVFINPHTWDDYTIDMPIRMLGFRDRPLVFKEF